MKTAFRQSDILKIFPWIKRRTLMSWSEIGLIQAEYGEAQGRRGVWRSYSYDNLLEIALISEFTYSGIHHPRGGTATPHSVMLVIKKYRQAIREKAYDRIFMIGHVKKNGRFSIMFQDVSEAEFEGYETKVLFPPEWGMSSFTAISLRSLKEYVDQGIRGLV